MRAQCDLLNYNKDGTLNECALRFCEVSEGRKKKNISYIKIVQNRMANSRVNSTEFRCKAFLDETDKHTGCPEMTNELASKHTH